MPLPAAVQDGEQALVITLGEAELTFPKQGDWLLGMSRPPLAVMH